MKRTKKLRKIKKSLFWKNHVPVQDMKSFMQMEEEDTHDDLINFYTAPEGEEKEKYRKIILDKRIVFLKKYIAGEVELKELKEYNETTETVFEMFYKWIKC